MKHLFFTRPLEEIRSMAEAPAGKVMLSPCTSVVTDAFACAGREGKSHRHHPRRAFYNHMEDKDAMVTDIDAVIVSTLTNIDWEL